MNEHGSVTSPKSYTDSPKEVLSGDYVTVGTSAETNRSDIPDG